MRLLILAGLISVTCGEFFTALVDLESVIYTEGGMLDTLDHYIEQQEKNLQKLKDTSKEIRRINRQAMEDPESFLAHPVHAFTTVKRFLWEWVLVEGRVRGNQMTQDYLTNMSQYQNYFPGKEDLIGAAMALLRLQDTYKLDVRDIAEGNIKGVTKYQPTMTAEDVFEVGRAAYNANDHYHSESWLKEALRQLREEEKEEKEDEEEGEKREIDLPSVLDYLAFATYENGDMKKALAYTDELLEIEPTHARGKNNKDFFEYHLEQSKKSRGDTGDIPGDDKMPEIESLPQELPEDLDESDPYQRYTERQMYEALCRGDNNVLKNLTDARSARILKCSYQNYGEPMLFLAPAKEEIVFPDPLLIYFRGILDDYEITHIKKTAAPKLKRATIQNSVTGDLEYADYRISKSAWLKPDFDQIVQRVRRRVAAYTRLDLHTAEDLQVVNYGIGGHYEPHFDFARNRSAYSNGIGNRIATVIFYKEEVNAFKDLGTGNRIATMIFYAEEVNAFKRLGTGNRIATMIFYLSDIEAGGATVFPRCGARIHPTKGDAAFWYNLYRNGEGNFRTRHAACPVLSGSKWVANIWIHEMGQEFRRKCSLNPRE